MRFARLAGLIDRYVVYCSWQRDFIREEFGVPSERIVLSTFMVDTEFFDPALVDVEQERMICSAGLERRDYPTLMEAVEGLDVQVVIAAASPWSKQSDATERAVLPANVEVRRLDLFELRELYARSRFVVMPLEEVEFQAGITTILEAMSMGRPVVCTRTPGQTDTVIEGETGRYVPPKDVAAIACGNPRRCSTTTRSRRGRWRSGPASGSWPMPTSRCTPIGCQRRSMRFAATRPAESDGGACTIPWSKRRRSRLPDVQFVVERAGAQRHGRGEEEHVARFPGDVDVEEDGVHRDEGHRVHGDHCVHAVGRGSGPCGSLHHRSSDEIQQRDEAAEAHLGPDPDERVVWHVCLELEHADVRERVRTQERLTEADAEHRRRLHRGGEVEVLEDRGRCRSSGLRRSPGRER